VAEVTTTYPDSGQWYSKHHHRTGMSALQRGNRLNRLDGHLPRYLPIAMFTRRSTHPSRPIH